MLIAGGGGGGAEGSSNGGSAGLPSGGAGATVSGGGGGGGNNTTMMGGSAGHAGSCSFPDTCPAGTAGAVFSPVGPGAGGTGGGGTAQNGGGGGGGGYYGGGGGGNGGFGGAGGGGGGGGSDFCASSLPAPSALSGCGVAGANATFGTASVTLAYTVPAAVPAAPCIVSALKGKTFKKAKQALQRANCHTGNVKRIGHKPRRVVRESPKAGTALAGGSPIDLKVKGAT